VGGSVFDLAIDVPIDEMRRDLREFERRQLPYATALALTRTVQDAQNEIQQALPRRFIIRNDFLAKGIRIAAAKKTKLEARVFTVDEILRRQIMGGSKGGRGHAVALPRDVRTNKRGIISRAKRPRALREKARHFVAPTRDGERALFRRRTKKRYPLELLYRLQYGLVRITERLDFEDIATRIFKREFDDNFDESLRRALRTAR
jgi:hypothetical protein